VAGRTEDYLFTEACVQVVKDYYDEAANSARDGDQQEKHISI